MLCLLRTDGVECCVGTSLEPLMYACVRFSSCVIIAHSPTGDLILRVEVFVCMMCNKLTKRLQYPGSVRKLDGRISGVPLRFSFFNLNMPSCTSESLMKQNCVCQRFGSCLANRLALMDHKETWKQMCRENSHITSDGFNCSIFGEEIVSITALNFYARSLCA